MAFVTRPAATPAAELYTGAINALPKNPATTRGRE